MVEQVGDREEERGCAALDGAIGDGGGEVCLAAAGHSGQHQPALWGFGVPASGLDGERVARLRVPARGAAAREQCVEGEASECAEARVAQQASLTLAAVLAGDALTGDGPAEVGAVRVGGDAHEARPVAQRADLDGGFRSGG